MDQPRAFAVRGRRLTAWAMARPTVQRAPVISQQQKTDKWVRVYTWDFLLLNQAFETAWEENL
jgi:hypothetical protein